MIGSSRFRLLLCYREVIKTYTCREINLKEFQEWFQKVQQNTETTIKDKYPDAVLGFYATEPAQRNMEKGAIVSNMKTNNQLVVPAWSEKIDQVMYFLDWMYGSPENHDLFQYGIEGVGWGGRFYRHSVHFLSDFSLVPDRFNTPVSKPGKV